MKNILFAAAAAALFTASCAKIETEPQPAADPAVTVSFVAQPNSEQTRAFFDPTMTTEAWEKSLSSLAVFVFGESGDLIVQRNFTVEELTARCATFPVPRSAAGTNCEFYAVGNHELTGITTKATLLAQLEKTPETYNGTFAEVSTKAKRSGGFLMSGNVAKTIGASGSSTPVEITLKRTVAKIAIQAVKSSDFGTRYSGDVKITSATISKAASQTTIFPQSSMPSVAMTYTATQTTQAANGKFNNLFYLYECKPLATGERVLLTLTGTYDRDGNFTTTSDQTPVTYEIELSGASGNGQIVRNGYYRISATINGLTGEDIVATITVADWESPGNQTIVIGQ